MRFESPGSTRFHQVLNHEVELRAARRERADCSRSEKLHIFRSLSNLRLISCRSTRSTLPLGTLLLGTLPLGSLPLVFSTTSRLFPAFASTSFKVSSVDSVSGICRRSASQCSPVSKPLSSARLPTVFDFLFTNVIFII